MLTRLIQIRNRKCQIDYKILTLTHKCVYGEAPKYLTDLITEQGVRWDGLRSAEMINRLEVPFTKCKILQKCSTPPMEQFTK